MAKFNFNTKKANLKDVAQANGYFTEKGAPDSAGLKERLDNDGLRALRNERLERAATSFELAFIDVLTARRIAGETLSRSSFEQVSTVVVGLIKNVFDASELIAALVCVESGIRELPVLRKTVTCNAEYAELIKRMKMLLTGRRVIACAKHIGAINREQMKTGFDFLNGKRQDVQNVNHAQGMGNLWLLTELGYEFKGLQTAERLQESLKYLDSCAAYQQTWDVDVFAAIFGFSKPIVQETDTHEDEINLQASDDQKSLVEQIGGLPENEVLQVIEAEKPASGRRATKAKLAA